MISIAYRMFKKLNTEICKGLIFSLSFFDKMTISILYLLKDYTMSDAPKRCLICKYMTSNVENLGPYKGTIYNQMGKPIQINLCRPHERELFILGQFNFLDKYESKRTRLLEVDQDYSVILKLMEILRVFKEKLNDLQNRRAG